MRKPRTRIKGGFKKLRYKQNNFRLQRSDNGWWTSIDASTNLKFFGPGPLKQVRKAAMEFIDEHRSKA